MDRSIWMGYTRWLHKTQLNNLLQRSTIWRQASFPTSFWVTPLHFCHGFSFLVLGQDQHSHSEVLQQTYGACAVSIINQAGNGVPAWKHWGNGIPGTGSAGVCDWDCGYASLPANIWTEPEIEFIRPEYNFDTRHLLILFVTGCIFSCYRYLFTGTSIHTGLFQQWCWYYRADMCAPCQLVDKKREKCNLIQMF